MGAVKTTTRKPQGGLWAKAHTRAQESSNSWTVLSEEKIPLEERRSISTVTVEKGKQGYPVARISYKDGKSAIFALDWTVQRVTELGDQLMIGSLSLLLKKGPEGQECLTLKGQPK